MEPGRIGASQEGQSAILLLLPEILVMIGPVPSEIVGQIFYRRKLRGYWTNLTKFST